MTDLLGEAPFDGALPPYPRPPAAPEPSATVASATPPGPMLFAPAPAPLALAPTPVAAPPPWAAAPLEHPPLELPPLTDGPPPRRAYGAAKATRIVVIAFAVLAVTNSRAFVQAGEGMEDGWLKTVTLSVARPVDDVSTFLRLDRPRARVDAFLGREAVSGPGVSPGVQPGPVVPGSAAPVTQPPTTPGVPTESAAPAAPVAPAVSFRDATAADPLRLFITGDSMIEFWGSKLINAADDKGALKAKVDVRYGTGLVRPDFFDWHAHAPKAIAEQDPEAVMIMMGGNDGQNIKLPSGQILQAGSREWQAEYQRRAAALMAALSVDGRRVYWVGMPIPKSSKLRPRFESANTAASAAASANPAVRFVDIWDLFAKNGAYADYLPDSSGKQVLARARDGIHLSRDGAERLTAHLLPIVDGEWKLLN